MKIKLFSDGRTAANCYLLESGGHFAIVDPSLPPEALGFADGEASAPDFLLLTHGHFDHMLALSAWRNRFPNAQLCISRIEQAFLSDPVLNCYQTLLGIDHREAAADRLLEREETLILGKEPIRCLCLPGHTAGSTCFFVLCDGALYRGADGGQEYSDILCGDTVFCGAVGRWDLPSGDPDQLCASLAYLAKCPDGVILHPGHGAETTVGAERRHYLPYPPQKPIL